MKRFTSMLVLALVLTLGAGIASAGNGAKPAKADRAAKRDAKGVIGTVVKVDGANILLQTRGKKGAEVTITTDATTKFDVNGKPGTIEDIKAGVNIQASPTNGTAQKITVKDGKGNNAKAAKKAAKNA